MRSFVRHLLTGAVLLTAVNLGSAAEPAAPDQPRFTLANMDPSVSPGTDFARYAWGHWKETHPIPGDKARWGSFAELLQANQNGLKSILESAAATSHEPGSVEQKVGDFYASAMDTAGIDAAGLQPAMTDLAQVAAIRSMDDLARTLAALHNEGIGGFFYLTVDADEKNSSVNILQAGQTNGARDGIAQGGLSLPNRDYYFGPEFAPQRAAFVEHVARMFTLAGDTPADAAAAAKTVLALETGLAEKASTRTQLRDSVANYNKMPVTELAAKFPAFPFQSYLAERGLTGPAAAEIDCGQPAYFAGLQDQFAARPLAELKTYLRFQVLRAAAPYLASAFEQESFNFNGTVLTGAPVQEPRWQRAAVVIDKQLGEALGQLYVARYYPAEAQARMTEMVDNIVAVMHDRLARLDWMSEATKQKALAKFDRFYAKIGHPEKWRDYKSVDVRRDSFYGNVLAARGAETRRQLARLGQPVDKAEWAMTPPTVNAYFDPTANNINFPAGILQPPFFDFSLDDAVNYGGIGAVIGHEITHGFDDQGRHYDAEGNLSDWWTPEDAAAFESRAQKVVDQFDAIEVLPGLHVNGRLTLGENIADLGGVSLAYEALERSLRGKERKLIGGLTPEQRFFIAFSQVWKTNTREAELRRRISVDPHAPGEVRSYAPLQNFQEFYDAFGIKEGDPMWRKPELRARIW